MSFAIPQTEIYDINRAGSQTPHPVLILTINNSAAHIKVAEAVATAWRKINGKIPAQIIEMSVFMSPFARFMIDNALFVAF
jgi:hypothetical protein